MFVKYFYGLILAMAGLASAASVAPFEFEGVPADSQQIYWDKLMSFKIWGTEGITLGRSVISDSLGAVGTASGDLAFLNDGNKLAGPIYVGGNVVLSNGVDYFTGPVRTTGNFLAGPNGNEFYGTYCIGGSVNEYASSDISASGGSLYTGTAATKGACSYDKVPAVLTNLKVPDYPSALTSNTFVLGNIDVGRSTYIIDVPPEEAVIDFSVENFVLGDGAKLNVRMQSPWTLVRIFAKSIDISSTAIIQVVYVDEQAVYSKSKWTNITTETPVSNEDYAGNLLFYSKQDMTWPSMNSSSHIQGTFMTHGTMTLGSNLVLSGQIIASEVMVGSDFDGKSVRYVPFDPPTISLDPILYLSSVDIAENNSNVEIPLKLNKEAMTDVTFKYCYDVKDSASTPAGVASIQDFNRGSSYPSFPICDAAYESVKIKAGALKPTSKIYLNAMIDALNEGSETLTLRVYDLEGAVLSNGNREGSFNLVVDDAPLPSGPVISCLASDENCEGTINVRENEPTGKVVHKYAVSSDKNVNTLLVTLADANGKGADKLFAASLSLGENVEIVITVKDGFSLDYEKLNSSYSVKITVTDEDGLSDSIVRTIKILDVNEPPVIFDATFEVAENSPVGTVVGTVQASDPDVKNAQFRKLTFSIVEDVPFKIDGDVIVVKDPMKLDYETNPSFIFTVNVNDGGIDALSSVTVNVLDVNEELSSSSAKSSSSRAKSSSSEASSSSSARSSSSVLSSSSAKSSSSKGAEIIEDSSSSAKSSSSQKVSPKSSSSRAKSSSSELSSSSSSVKVSSSSAQSSSSSQPLDEFPGFRLKMTGPFQFTIVLAESVAKVQKNYAVMDLQGRVLYRGVAYSGETEVPALSAGSYVVRVGVAMRRVNIR